DYYHQLNNIIHLKKIQNLYTNKIICSSILCTINSFYRKGPAQGWTQLNKNNNTVQYFEIYLATVIHMIINAFIFIKIKNTLYHIITSSNKWNFLMYF